jgi:hypothetical protein
VVVKQRQKVLNKFMETALYKKFFSGMAGEALGQWAKKGGLQNYRKSLSCSGANALGFATSGGLANLVINAVAMVVSDALFAIGKILFGMVIFALIGVVGMIVMMTGGQYKQNKQTYAYANTVPGDVIYNPNYIDEEYIISGGEPGAPGTIYTGDIEEIYRQVAAEMGLNTKLKLVTCTSGDDGADEAACNQIDWAWCYSGTQVFCKADKLALASDAGLTNLFRHELFTSNTKGRILWEKDQGRALWVGNGEQTSCRTMVADTDSEQVQGQ